MVENAVFGYGKFASGDQVLFRGENATVCWWDFPIPKFTVPIQFDDDKDRLVHLVHHSALSLVGVAEATETVHVARIGHLGTEGQWQPIGEHFEVMWQAVDPAGSFRIRERQR